MVKLENVDILATLEEIMLQNTAFYQTDFTYDREQILKYMDSENPEDKHLLWLSRPSGTHCFVESEVYKKGTPSHQAWNYYAFCSSDYILAYAVELKGIKSDIVYGDLYQLDFREYAATIQKYASEYSHQIVHYEKGEMYRDISECRNYLGVHPELGAVQYIEYIPEDMEAHNCTLREQRAERKRKTIVVDKEKHIVAVHTDWFSFFAKALKEEYHRAKQMGKTEIVLTTHQAFIKLATDSDIEALTKKLRAKKIKRIINGQSRKLEVYS